MRKTKPAPQTETQRIARSIMDDVIRIEEAYRWQDVSEKLVSIQRAARQLLLDTSAPEPLPINKVLEEVPLEEAIADGYRQAVERQLEGAALMLGRIDDANLHDPRTIGICLLMMNMATATLHKYMRASLVATELWETAVQQAETDMGLHQRRPLDIDGQSQDQQEVVNG